MERVDYLTLISGSPVRVEDAVVYPPHLCDIARIGYNTFEENLSVWMFNKSELRKILNVDNLGELEEYPILKIITQIQDLRIALLQSMRFFLCLDVGYSPEFGYFFDSQNGRGYLDFKQIKDVRSIILQLCNVDDDVEDTPVKFKNAKAKEIYEKIQREKSKKKRSSVRDEKALSMTLPNLISAVAAFSPTYNYSNIWDLTIYQFYDQFARLNDRLQLDVFGHRWAAWGTDNFDFSVWYRPLSKIK